MEIWKHSIVHFYFIQYNIEKKKFFLRAVQVNICVAIFNIFTEFNSIYFSF